MTTTVWIAERAIPYEGSDLICVATTSDVAKACVLKEIRETNAHYRELYGPDNSLIGPEPVWSGDDEAGWHWDSRGEYYSINQSEVLS